MSAKSLVAVIALVLTVVAAACGAADTSVRGIVVDVQGDLTTIDRFTVLTEAGERIDFEPAPDVRFHDGAPLSHLNEHLRTGSPVEVTFRMLDDGTRAATGVEDVGS